MKSISEGLYGNMNWSNRSGYGSPLSGDPTGTNYPTQVGPGQVAPQNIPNLANAPIIVDHCANLKPWQQQLVGILSAQTREDIYILSQPGSGKTAPIICHWVNNILQISTSQVPNTQNLLRLITEPQNIPQVLWLVPIRNLGVNIQEEMTERFVDIILQILNRTGYIDPSSGNMIFSNTQLDINEIIRALSVYEGGGQSRDLLFQMIQNGQIVNTQISEFKTSLGQLVKNFVEQALIGRIQEEWNKTRDNRTKKLKPFIISIYESSKHVISEMDRLRLIVFDEAQRIQGGDKDADSRAAQIGDSIHKVLFDDNARRAQIVMLSGSTNPKTASNVVHYFNMTYDRHFNLGVYQTPINVTNPADIRVFPMANLDDTYTQLRIIQTALAGGNLRKGGIVFIIFGKNRINQLIDQLAPSETGYITPGKNISSSKGSLYSKSDVSHITKPGDINEIKDDRLRRAASHGLGFLYRPDELNADREKDTTIVQRLFKDGIIRVLFATDAVREGMNITCKEMYIPSILLPPNKREMDAGSLTQLINRAGRKEGTYATIYTDPKFVGNITRALSKDSNRFNEEPFMLPGSKYEKLEAGLNYGLNIPGQAAEELGRALRRVF